MDFLCNDFYHCLYSAIYHICTTLHDILKTYQKTLLPHKNLSINTLHNNLHIKLYNIVGFFYKKLPKWLLS